MSHAGTKSWMAPEMFSGQPYTAAVDIYALGLVIAWLLTGGLPKKPGVIEGPSWCEDLVKYFKEYEERDRAIKDHEHGHVSLTTLVAGHVL